MSTIGETSGTLDFTRHDHKQPQIPNQIEIDYFSIPKIIFLLQKLFSKPNKIQDEFFSLLSSKLNFVSKCICTADCSAE